MRRHLLLLSKTVGWNARAGWAAFLSGFCFRLYNAEQYVPFRKIATAWQNPNQVSTFAMFNGVGSTQGKHLMHTSSILRLPGLKNESRAQTVFSARILRKLAYILQDDIQLREALVEPYGFVISSVYVSDDRLRVIVFWDCHRHQPRLAEACGAVVARYAGQLRFRLSNMLQLAVMPTLKWQHVSQGEAKLMTNRMQAIAWEQQAPSTIVKEGGDGGGGCASRPGREEHREGTSKQEWVGAGDHDGKLLQRQRSGDSDSGLGRQPGPNMDAGLQVDTALASLQRLMRPRRSAKRRQASLDGQRRT